MKMTVLRKTWVIWVTGAVLLLAVTLPYLYAANAAGENHVFAGFLFNPLDGNSYLAKMIQGYQGEWQFRLPYTAEPGQGAYLFVYYLLLGHGARLLGVSNVFIYHVARLAAAVFMLLALYRFCKAVLPESRLAWLAFGLAALGAGLGWLALPFGAFTADFWVAEAYPFLSSYANPHFPLSLGLLLWILTPPGFAANRRPDARARIYMLNTWSTAPLAFILALVSPFAVVLALLVLGSTFALGVLAHQKQASSALWIYASRMVWVAVVGLPVLVYDQWATIQSPQLSAWNAQNVTPAPALWDVLVSFSPLLLLAALGVWRLWKEGRNFQAGVWESWLVPLVWVALSLVLLYAPFNLQRRFILGLYVPLSVLAVWGVAWLAGDSQKRFRLIAILLFILVLPSNILVVLAARHGVQQLDPMIYLGKDEAAALQWLRQNAEQDALVLASPRTGLFIPAHTGRRVVYGHPYETVQAERNKQAVEAFYSGAWTGSQTLGFLTEQGVDYIFYGPQERALGDIADQAGLSPVFQSGNVLLYAVQPSLAHACAWNTSRIQNR